MCRYSMHPSKTHFACLPCRFTSKHWGARWREVNVYCPHCGELMVDLGRDFKAPRRQSVSQWRKVEMLAAAGITFDSCGCSGPGSRPKSLSDAKSQLHTRRSDVKSSEVEKVPKCWPRGASLRREKRMDRRRRQWQREVLRTA
jgi:hypothetical protein